MASFTTHLTALLDASRWEAVENQMHAALADLGLWNDGIDVRIQRNYCEEDNMLLDQHMSLHEQAPTIEEIHLIRVRLRPASEGRARRRRGRPGDHEGAGRRPAGGRRLVRDDGRG